MLYFSMIRAGSPSGNATHNTGISMIHSCSNAFSEKLLTSWYVLAILVCQEIYHNYQLQRDGIDRPSFGATVLKGQNKYGLSDREQAWIVGNMLCVSLSSLCSRRKLKSKVSSISVLRVKRQQLLRSIGGFSPCSHILMFKPRRMPSSTRS